MLLFITIIASVRYFMWFKRHWIYNYKLGLMARYKTVKSSWRNYINSMFGTAFVIKAGSSVDVNDCWIISVLLRMFSPEVHILSEVSVLSFPKRLIQSWRPRHRTRRRSRQAGIEEEAPLGCWRRRVSAEGVGGGGRPAAPVVTVPGETILPAVVGEVEGGGGGRGVPDEYIFQKQPILMSHWINKAVRGLLPASRHQTWKFPIWEVHIFPVREQRVKLTALACWTNDKVTLLTVNASCMVRLSNL